MKSSISIFLLSLFLWFSATAENQVKISRIKINVPDRTTLAKIWSSGIDYEGSTGKPGGSMEFVAGKTEMEALRERGINFEILIDDLSNYEASRLVQNRVSTEGFGNGSMSGHYTYAEVGRVLDSMRSVYPNLITAKSSIGSSYEGRPIWVAKISDNPETNEPEEPEVLYTALHHAREPEGMMSILYYMWWLMDNYTTDERAAYLVKNRQMYFIPVVNADGYVYNQLTNPTGGGMWRKNRRLNSDGSYGVDLNRNYGNYAMWNSVNGGSSIYPSYETYRGTAPFSEPEISAMDTFMRAHAFKNCLNYHTYGNYLIYPWGYLSRESGDSLIYRDWSYEMQFDNHYTNGTDQQTVNYSTRGNSDDYMFGDTDSGKTVTYAMTPEVGTSGFWAAPSEIIPLAQQNLIQNRTLAYTAGSYPCLISSTVQDDGGDGFIDRSEHFTLLLNVKNRGLVNAHRLWHYVIEWFGCIR